MDNNDFNPFEGHSNLRYSNKSSLNGASLNGASLNGASLNGASLNGASLNGASLNGASLTSFHTHFHKASVAQSPIEVSKHLTSAVNSVSSDTPSHVKQEYYNSAKSMLVKRSHTTLPSIDPTKVELDSNLRSLVDRKPIKISWIAKKAAGLGELGFMDSIPQYAKFLVAGVVLGCVYKRWSE